MTYNSETVKSLLSIYAGDGEMIEIILDALDSFEKYHQAIYTLELRRELHIRGAMDDETYREEIPHLDQIRSTRHNAVISSVKMLNRMAEQNGLRPFYDGIVSEERPYRTQVADSILLFVREIIENRVTGK